MASVPDPTVHKGGSIGFAADESGATPSGLRGRSRIFGACAIAAFFATAGAYLQPVRDDPLQPAAPWQQALYPIESNAPFRPADAARTPWLQDVFVTADGASAFAVGQAGANESDGYLILKSADGGDHWEVAARGDVPVPEPAPADAPATSQQEPAQTGADVANAAADIKQQLAQQQELVDFAGGKGDGGGKGESKAPNMAAKQSFAPLEQQQALTPDPQADAQSAEITDALGGATTPNRGLDGRGGLRAIWMSPDGKRGWAVGAGGFILHTENGSTWAREDSPTTEDIVSVSFGADGVQGWVASLSTIFEHDQSGWQARTQFVGDWERVVAAADGHSAWAMTRDCAPFLLRPGDMRQKHGPLKGGGCRDLAAPPDGSVVYLAKDDGIYYQVADGNTFNQFPEAPATDLTAIATQSDLHQVWVGTAKGEILRNSQTWTTQLTTSGSISRLAVSDAGTRIIAISGNAILTSADGGKTWQVPDYRRYPAPWLYASWFAIFGVGFLRVRAEEQALEEQADEAIAPEIEADAPALKLADDRLAFTPIVEILAKFLRNTGTRPPLTISIDGEWGSGKTSMMRMLQGELRALGFPTVWFNPWHHQKEDVMLAGLLQHIRTEGLPFPLHPRGIRYRTRLITGRILAHPFATAFILIGLLTPVFYFLRHNPGDAFGYFGRIIKPAVDLIGALIPPSAESAGKIADSLTDPGLWFTVSFVIAAFFFVNGLRSFPLSPAALLATLNSKFSAHSAENQTDFRRRFGETFGMVTGALSPRPMVIFIDDLDRCLPEKALETLEATNYLASCGQCFIVLGMARARVERLIGLASERLAAEMADMEGGEYRRIHKEADTQRDLRRNYARRYLEKLVQLNVRVPSSDGRRLMRLLNPEAEEAEAEEAEEAARPDPVRLLRRGWAYGGFAIVLACAGAFAYGLAAYDWPSLQPPVHGEATAGTEATAGPAASGDAAAGTPATSPDQAATPVPAPTHPLGLPPATTAQSSGSGIAYWPILLLFGFVGYLLYRASLGADAPINETPYYQKAIADWNGVVVSRQRSPRSVKLFGNLARYTAMMLLEPEKPRKLVTRRRLSPLFGKSDGTEPAVPAPASTAAHERDCVAVALAAIYHVRPDILDGSGSIISPDWQNALDAMRKSDQERYHQRLVEIRALLDSRVAAPGAVPLEPTEAELAAAEGQALADPDLREELLRLRSRRAAAAAIAETIQSLPAYYGAWPPSADIVRRFRLFVMGSVEAERLEESPAP
jgi:hypothetical protein